MNRRAFTLIEVLCCVLVLGIGLASVIGMFSYGQRLAGRAIGEATAWVTAQTVAHTPTLPSDSPAVLDWNGSQGYVNGYWVTRTTISTTTLDGGLQRVVSKAEVYDANAGKLLASDTAVAICKP